jgi:hypothetical protein
MYTLIYVCIYPYLSLSELLALVSGASVGHEGGILSLDGDVILREDKLRVNINIDLNFEKINTRINKYNNLQINLK